MDALTNPFEDLLERSSQRHKHLCPRQVLGVRMGILAGETLGLVLPQENKRLLTLVETDGCFADGIAVATGCELGHRTLRLMDYGKVAATFIDTQTEQAIRIRPHPDSRSMAQTHKPAQKSRWQNYLAAYQELPYEELFIIHSVVLNFSLKTLLGHPKMRAICCTCHEEILNGREVFNDGQISCQACFYGAYYQKDKK